MKTTNRTRIFLTMFTALLICGFEGRAQDEFGKHMADAKKAFAANNLNDARFAMQQMMYEIDLVIGKNVLKLLPTKLDGIASNAANDNVAGGSGFIGVIVHRDFGRTDSDSSIELEVINNSPLLVALNSLLAMPILVNGQDRKVVKIAGYKALVEATTSGSQKGQQVQVPVGNTLVMLKLNSGDQAKAIRLAEAIPIAEIAKLGQ